MNEIKVLKHSSIRIKTENSIIYIDPFKIDDVKNDADYIFITHSHYDHFSVEDIKKVMNKDTKLIVTEDIKIEAEKLIGKGNVESVKPNEKYDFGKIYFETVPAYNMNKKFHQKENNWVGYIISSEGERIYIAGDTDNLPELANITCDICLVPIGGTYTMSAKEAANLVNKINPKKAIPTHYGLIVGEKEDAITFKKLVEKAEVDIQI